jgi:uncharacterized SAM-binding protein YcdF (DUF218 family)
MRRVLTRVLVLAAAGAVVIVAYATYRIWDQGEHDERQPADAIVVLGAAQYDGRPSPVFKARLQHAVELYEDGIAPYLVVTGGNAPGDRTTEAAVARDYALAHGVPEKAILVEDHGRTTLESLRSVAKLLQSHQLHSAVFVSDRTHMLRVLRMARDQGMTSFGSPTSTSPTDGDLTSRADATVHELGALAFYFITGTAGLEPASR